MKKLLAVLSVVSSILVASCASQTSRTPGAGLNGSDGIAAVQVTLLADRPASVLLRLSKQYFVGAMDSFEVSNGKPVLVFRDMTAGKYSWYSMMTTASYAPDVNLGGRLPDFTIKKGCITPVGAVVIDLRGGSVRVSHSDQNHEQLLAEVRQQYPAEISKYGICN